MVKKSALVALRESLQEPERVCYTTQSSLKFWDVLFKITRISAILKNRGPTKIAKRTYGCRPDRSAHTSLTAKGTL